jgi:lysophospholipase L1-like esterase
LNKRLSPLSVLNAFAKQYAAIADLNSYYFMDASSVCSASEADALHLTEEAHMRLANALCKKIIGIFGDEDH